MVLAIIPLVGIVYMFQRVGEGVIQDKVNAHLTGLAEKSAIYLDSYLGERLYDLKVFSFLVTTPTGVKKDLALETFDFMKALTPTYVDFFFLDKQGKIIIGNRPYDPAIAGLLDSSINIKQAEKNGFVSSVIPYLVPQGKIPAVFVAVPLNEHRNVEQGLAVAAVDFRSIEDYLKQSRFEKTGELYLVDRNGRFITTPRLRVKSHPDKINLEKIDSNGISRYTDYRGQYVLRASQSLKRTDWLVVAEQDQDEALEQAMTLRQTVYVLASLFIAGIFLVAWAISGRIVGRLKESHKHEKELEFQTIHNSKLAALGMLTSGLAHEVNTPLASALLYTQMLGEEMPPEQISARQQLAVIEDEIKQCSKIVRNLLDVARMSPREDRICDVNAVLEKLLSIAQVQIESRHVKLHSHLSPGLPMAEIGETVIQEVFTTLIVNALEAMPAGGVLRIGTRYIGVLEKIVIEVCDTGVGIPAKFIGKLFEPFFTTKEAGGTGLGLYMSHEIIKRYGGSMRVISNPPKEAGQQGMTIFTVELPVARSES